MPLTGPAVTNAIKLRYAKETTFGTSPGGTFQEVRFTSEDFGTRIDAAESQVIRADSQLDNVLRNDAEGQGGFSFELAAETQFEDMMRYTLMSVAFGSAVPEAWVATTSEIGTVAPAAGVPGYFTKTDDWDTAIYKVGMWIKGSGFSNNAANDAFKIVAIDNALAPNRLYVAGPALPTLAASSGNTSWTVTVLSQLANGVTLEAMHFEREYTDNQFAASDDFIRFPGYTPSEISLDVPTQGVVTGRVGLIGKLQVGATTSTAGSNTAPATTEQMVSGLHGYRVNVGDPQLTTVASSDLNWGSAPKTLGLTMRIANRARSRKAIGTVGPALAHGRGDFDITGTARFYYNELEDVNDSELFNDFLNNTPSALTTIIKDSAGNFYIFDLPRIKWTAGRRDASRRTEDVILDMQWRAYRSPSDDQSLINSTVSGCMFRCAKGVTLGS